MYVCMYVYLHIERERETQIPMNLICVYIYIYIYICIHVYVYSQGNLFNLPRWPQASGATSRKGAGVLPSSGRKIEDGGFFHEDGGLSKMGGASKIEGSSKNPPIINSAPKSKESPIFDLRLRRTGDDTVGNPHGAQIYHGAMRPNYENDTCFCWCYHY